MHHISAEDIIYDTVSRSLEFLGKKNVKESIFTSSDISGVRDTRSIGYGSHSRISEAAAFVRETVRLSELVAIASDADVKRKLCS